MPIKPSSEQPNKTTTKKRKINYLSNERLLVEVIASKEQGRMNDGLARMLQLLTAKYAEKSNWVNYTFNNDMQSYAMLMLVRTWNSFDPEKSSNPFAFFTQCIKHSFIQFLKQEKRQRDIRDAQLVEMGLSPSYTCQMEYAEKQKENAEVDPSDQPFEDYDHISNTVVFNADHSSEPDDQV